VLFGAGGVLLGEVPLCGVLLCADAQLASPTFAAVRDA
jgi:hypothetical protein